MRAVEHEGGRIVASVAMPNNAVEIIAAEIASGVDRAVECWMSQIDEALTDARLTPLGRLHAVRQIVENYKHSPAKHTCKVEAKT